MRVTAGHCVVECVNHYPGFGAVRTRRGLVIHVLGAPRLYGAAPIGVTRDDVITSPENGASAGVIAVLLRESDPARWGAFLAGNYALMLNDVARSTCWVITDLGNSYRIFQGSSNAGDVCFGTDVDRLALTIGRSGDLDDVSLVEYLTQVSCTYPYTFYAGIREVPYASATRIMYRSTVYTSVTQYWLPTCRMDERVDDIHALAYALRDGVTKAATAVLQGKRRVGLLLSGGIDSRAIAGIVEAFGIRCTAITVVDEPNRESATAGRIALTTGHDHEVWLRDREYYPRLCDAFIASEGPHATFTRGLHLGFRERILAKHFDALLGGYMSDTLLKLHEANVRGKYWFGRHLGPLEAFDPSGLADLRGGDRWRASFRGIFHAELLKAAAERRRNLMEYWENLRRDGSAWEWSWMWPFFRNQHNDNLTTHIFHYPSIELFTEREVIEVARVASQHVKLNGRLFNAAMWPFLRRTAHIPVAVSGLPMVQSAWLSELAVALKHLPPRRWMFRQDCRVGQVRGSVAMPGSYANTERLWESSPVLARYRHAYDSFALEQRIMCANTHDVFDGHRYSDVTARDARHIMYTMLHLDRWRKYCRRLRDEGGSSDRVPVAYASATHSTSCDAIDPKCSAHHARIS